MFNRLRMRIRDVNTIKTLCLGAEQYARQNGEEEPGAEHFLLSAIDLPDGTARRAFARVEADADRVRAAIFAQYDDALRSIGVDASELARRLEDEPIKSPTGFLYKAKPSSSAVLQSLAALRSTDKDSPLVGAHVVEVIAGMHEGVAARSRVNQTVGGRITQPGGRAMRSRTTGWPTRHAAPTVPH